MTTETDDDIMDSLFHGCAWAAYLDEAAEQQGWPDSVATRQRAYRYYEVALAEKNRRPDAVLRPDSHGVLAPADGGCGACIPMVCIATPR